MFMNIKDKENILKPYKEKEQRIRKGIRIRLTSDFSIGLLTVLFMEIITCSLKLEIKKKVYAVRLCDKNKYLLPL